MERRKKGGRKEEGMKRRREERMEREMERKRLNSGKVILDLCVAWGLVSFEEIRNLEN